MHQRRIDTLAPLLDVLNPNVFQVILKETSLDVAQVGIQCWLACFAKLHVRFVIEKAANEAVELRYARVSAAASAGKPSVRWDCPLCFVCVPRCTFAVVGDGG
jgi:hypothetical protein